MTQLDPAAASPEGSAGLDMQRLVVLLERAASDRDRSASVHYTLPLQDGTLLRTLASALPSLIDAKAELDAIGHGPFVLRAGRGHFHVSDGTDDIGGCYDELSAITEADQLNARWRAERADRTAQLEASLIDASRERDRLAWIHKQNSEVLLESMREADQLKVQLIDANTEREKQRVELIERGYTTENFRKIAQNLEAQLTDARSRISELEVAADLADKKRHDAFDQLEAEKETRLEDLADQRKEWERANAAEDQVESLRSSREQAIAAIEAIKPLELGGENWVEEKDVRAVLSILRGAE